MSSEITTLPAGHPAITIDDTDRMHEIYWSDWTEFNDLRFGPDWRFALLSVLRENGKVEFVLIRHYENDMKDVLVHMECDKAALPNMINMAQGVVNKGSPQEPEPIEMELKKGEWKDY